MKTWKLFACFAAVLLSAGILSAATYQIDASHSTAGFTVRHMMVTNVSGAFTRLAGTVEFDPANPGQAKIDVSIESASVDTRNPKRDEHLRSADFFDVANHPKITFQSTKVERVGENHYRVTGNLTIRGVTKEVTLEVETTPEMAAQGAARMGASATTRINRKDFGVNWNRTLDAGGVVVSDEVRINIDVELVRKLAPPAKA